MKTKNRIAPALKPFETDGCSGGMSAAWQFFRGRPTPWEGECIEHDRAYHPGGSRAERLAADRKLRGAVAERDHPKTAAVMYYAIRLGGHPWWPLPWRWGFGYRWPRGYAGRPLERAGVGED